MTAALVGLVRFNYLKVKQAVQSKQIKGFKLWKSYDEQLEILRSRGLQIDDEKKALGYLRTIGYYRLSGYFYSFRQFAPESSKSRLDEFITDTRFEDVKSLYMFDKKLRQLALDALERIEVALRVNIAHTLGRHDPLAYKDSKYSATGFDHAEWLDRYNRLVEREKKTGFVKHHLEHYADLPVWVACEVWDFGTMSMLYKGMLNKDKDSIAKLYRLKDGKHLQTHLHAFNFIRNVSAHHSRLWNRDITFKASLKGLSDAEWKSLPINKPFVYFCLMKRMLDVICPRTEWGNRLLALLDEFPDVANEAVSLRDMGLENNPRDWRLWQG
ncbi:TPA: Abi family protein [Neisseria meningitidis]|uniref:Abi family protein n=1 Tax=Neisseria meningitidis TaxID=487 RepID=UPI000316A436|nr:Abi family protein [Neisseria meningitidis]ARB71695.1 CAAX protease [Neisseria meningitidis]ARC10722.1 CAAX protease [Neisseria meningitidis]MBW3867053.1 CAAX protease [Neisseria meningitidis]MBW3870529.1 CAAX protease [Neisseria meningitidis]MBW3875481.1 CAAX protease [Neisseria meningitidis]